MASPHTPNGNSRTHVKPGGQPVFHILEDADDNGYKSPLPLSSPVSSTRSLKNAARPSRLFRGAQSVPKKIDDEPLKNFENSKELAQLLTLPIKYREPSESFGKENDENGHNMRKVLAVEEEFKECGDSFKRPIPSKEFGTPLVSKRAKSALNGYWNCSPSTLLASLEVEDKSPFTIQRSMPPLPKECNNAPVPSFSRLLIRSQSESAVKKAVEQSSTDPLLVGDCSQRYALPVVAQGKHDDLKEIDSQTVVDLMNGKYASQIKSFMIVDCRYPYEFQGGHIKSAVNLYTQQQVNATFMESKVSKAIGDVDMERNIIIFHCEFSSRRAPSLCRYLRSADRLCNASAFPALHYPELYILFGGYKSFFQSHGELCEPQFYRTMLDENHKEDLRLYKSKSVSELATKSKSTKRFPRWASANVVKQPKF